jgi:hypothetical protein
MNNEKASLLFASLLLLEAVGMTVAPEATLAAVLALFAAVALGWFASQSNAE